MEALQAFNSHEHVVLDFSPPSGRTNVSATGEKRKDFDQISNAAVNPNWRVKTPIGPPFTSSGGIARSGGNESDQETGIFIRTKYNIQVELNKDASRVLNISCRPTSRRSTLHEQNDETYNSPIIREKRSNEPISTPSNAQ